MFVRSGTTWSQQQKLVPPAPATGSQFFGISVALSGETALIGALGDDDSGTNAGAAYVFVRSAGVWSQQQKLVPPAPADEDEFSQAVALSGETALIGANRDDDSGTNAGAAYVFVRSGGVWSQQQKLVPPVVPADWDFFGSTLDVAGDTALIGAWQDDDSGGNAGAAYVFVRSGGVWSQQQKLVPPAASGGDQFGGAVALSGETALIGASRDDDSGPDAGAAYVFVRSGTTWSQQQKLASPAGSDGDLFSLKVALAGDTALVGAIYDDDNGLDAGAAYVWVRSGLTWNQQDKLLRTTSDFFSATVALDGETALIGAYQEDSQGANAGAAYVFVQSGTVWSLQARLVSSDIAVDDFFGWSVALSGDTALVGAYKDDDNGSESGSAYVFTRSGTTWTQHQKLITSDGAGGDRFAWALALEGNTALIGAQDDDQGSSSGSVYVFTESGGTWTEQQKLLPADGSGGDLFGSALALSGNTTVIGARGDDDNGAESGSAYVFTAIGGTWFEQQKLLPADGSASDIFGISIALHNDVVLIGAKYNQINHVGYAPMMDNTSTGCWL